MIKEKCSLKRPSFLKKRERFIREVQVKSKLIDTSEISLQKYYCNTENAD